MAEFKSDVVNINADVSTVYAKLSHPELLQGLADQLPAEAKTKIENISFSEDTISVTANPVGEIKLSIVERIEPTLVKLSAVSSPIHLWYQFILKMLAKMLHAHLLKLMLS
ncbi:MAG: hypothetical protein RR854_05785 [Muribaculaceae bacterium]